MKVFFCQSFFPLLRYFRVPIPQYQTNSLFYVSDTLSLHVCLYAHIHSSHLYTHTQTHSCSHTSTYSHTQIYARACAVEIQSPKNTSLYPTIPLFIAFYLLWNQLFFFIPPAPFRLINLLGCSPHSGAINSQIPCPRR